MAMPIVISSHNGNTADASASTAASSSISSLKKKKSSRKRKIKASVHITSDQNMEETRNKKKTFAQQLQNEQPVGKVIARVLHEQKTDSLL
jgi:hypothetical protein